MKPSATLTRATADDVEGGRLPGQRLLNRPGFSGSSDRSECARIRETKGPTPSFVSSSRSSLRNLGGQSAGVRPGAVLRSPGSPDASNAAARRSSALSS